MIRLKREEVARIVDILKEHEAFIKLSNFNRPQAAQFVGEKVGIALSPQHIGGIASAFFPDMFPRRQRRQVVKEGSSKVAALEAEVHELRETLLATIQAVNELYNNLGVPVPSRLG